MQPDNNMISPRPAPETWGTGIADSNQGKLVEVRIFHVGGLHVSFLTPDGADQIADQIKAAAAQARSGLVIAPAGLQIVRPNGKAGR
jgi:hypothetical protein